MNIVQKDYPWPHGFSGRNSTDYIVWKDILGYEGLYQVSIDGQVRSLIKRNGLSPGITYDVPRALKLSSNGRDYLKLTLVDRHGNRKQHYVHRLVADTFLPFDLSKSEINHIDGNKGNNNLYNLERVTPSENRKHAWDNGLNYLSETGFNNMQRYNQLRKRPVICKNIATGEIEVFKSVSDAAREKNIDTTKICSCCKGKRNSAYGYRWEYEKGAI